MMLFVVMDHCNGHGIFGPEGMDMHALWQSPFAFLSVHIGGFVAISGWFGINFTWRKFLFLYCQVVFYSLLGCVAWNWRETNSLSLQHFRVFGGWFSGNYLALMLMAPFLNIAVDHLGGREAVVGKWGLLALVVILGWCPLGVMTGIRPVQTDEFSLFFMAFIYITARIAHHVFVKPLPLPRLVFWGASMFLWMFLSLAVKKIFPIVGGIDMVFVRSRMGPYYYCLSIILLMFFVWYVRVPMWVGRICTFISPSMFAVYLIHETTPMGRFLYLVPQKWLWENTSLPPFCVVIVTSVATFSICMFVDMARRGLFLIATKVMPIFGGKHKCPAKT